MKVITIDEERFVITIPKYKTLHDILKHNQKQPFTLSSGLNGKTLTWERDNTELLHMQAEIYHDDSILGRPLILKAPELHADQAQIHTFVNFRPVLIPIDKYDIYDDFLLQYKNGTILAFGTLEADGKLVHPLDLPTKKSIEQLTFSDSVSNKEKCIRWIVWNGTMVCTRCIAADIKAETFGSLEISTPTPDLHIKGYHPDI